jgi:ABC-type bacteriocin/lantibiotic exporter with double-glycine peptidase domain
MDNCVNVTKQLLCSLNIKYTSKYLKDSILSHPDHPSLLSISNTLEKYQIEILAVKIDFEKLKEMPTPCIVQVQINKRPLFFVLKNVLDNKVSYYDDKNK